MNKRKKKSSELSDESIKKIVRNKKIPILTLDARWHELFPAEKKTYSIRKYEKQINELLKRQGKLVQEAKDLQKLKKKLMMEIVNNMSETISQDERKEKKMENSQRLIREINEKLEKMDTELEQLPKKIKVMNDELLIESMKDSYDKLRVNREVINELADWIEKTRSELKEKVVRKQEIEEDNSMIYAYMHDILGGEMMDFFDEKQENI